VFIDADRRLRVMRHATATGMTDAESAQVIAAKDGRKRVVEQFTRWQQIADHWIENNHSIAQFRSSLEQIMTSTLARAGIRSAT
jgi:dephospho-CoA kinase